MKKIIAWLLVLSLTAAISIGATLAYLTDTDEDVNVMTLGKVKIDQLEYERVDVNTRDEDAEVRKFRDDKPMYPAVIDKEKFNWTAGDSYVDWEQIGKEDYTSSIWNPEQINNEVDKMVFVKNKGTYDAFVRTVFAFEAGQYENLDEFLKAVHMNRNETDWTWDWNTTPVAIPNKDGTVTTNYFIATATYNKAVQPGELTEISLAQLALDPAVTNEDLKAFGDTYQVLVKSQAIQADGFENELLSKQELIKSALDEGFGAVENNLPFEHDDPYRGADLRGALHNYMGDTTKVITNKITNVVFGQEANYPQITQNYTGTLVDVGQDIPAYVYYVEEGETYTVYFLSEDKIYAPEDSSKLFSGMAALTAVDTTNFDVSRVKIMDRMFYNSRKLKQVDVSNWDTSNVTSMNGTFFYCQSIDGLDVSNWDVSKVTTMYAMFYDCKELSALDVSNWDVGSVTIMEFTFGGCRKIEYLDVSNWDVSKVTSFDSFLSSSSSNVGNMGLKSIDVSKWNTSNVVDMFGMFYGCGSLTKLDLRGLDVENVTNMSHMFCDCYNLTEIDYTGWNTASIQTVDAMFNNCNSMTVIDVTEFDTETLEETSQMFEACYSLERIVGLETWVTPNLNNMQQMFQSSGKLKEVDLSAFNTSKVDDTQYMFNGCSSLTTIYVGDGWDMSNLKWQGNMFSSCHSLVGGAGTVFNSAKTNGEYARVDGGEANPGYLTHIKDKPVNP